MARPVKFYTDEHVAFAVAAGLRQRGADVVTIVDVGMLGAADVDHLAFASREGRVLVTQDSDFLRLHSAGLPHAGIVYAPQGTPLGTFIRGAMLVHQLLDADEMVGHVEFV